MATAVFVLSCVSAVVALGAVVWARWSLNAARTSAQEAKRHADRAEAELNGAYERIGYTQDEISRFARDRARSRRKPSLCQASSIASALGTLSRRDHRPPTHGRAVKREDIADEQVVAACRVAHAVNLKARSLDVLMEATGAPGKVALAAMYRACGNGLIDWGVTIELAWPASSDTPDQP